MGEEREGRDDFKDNAKVKKKKDYQYWHNSFHSVNRGEDNELRRSATVLFLSNCSIPTDPTPREAERNPAISLSRSSARLAVLVADFDPADASVDFDPADAYV